MGNEVQAEGLNFYGAGRALGFETLIGPTTPRFQVRLSYGAKRSRAQPPVSRRR